jgi:hypothetical protein
MRKIYKYKIEPKEAVQTFDLPVGAEIVAMRTQGVDLGFLGGTMMDETVQFWAIIDPKEEKKVPRRLMCVGTGWEIQPNIQEHIDTCITSSGLVWHLLEVK